MQTNLQVDLRAAPPARKHLVITVARPTLPNQPTLDSGDGRDVADGRRSKEKGEEATTVDHKRPPRRPCSSSTRHAFSFCGPRCVMARAQRSGCLRSLHPDFCSSRCLRHVGSVGVVLKRKDSCSASQPSLLCLAANHQQSSTGGAGGAPLANGTNGTDRHGTNGTDDGGSSEASQEQQQQQQTAAKRKKPKPPKAKKPTPASAAAALKLDDVASVSMPCCNRPTWHEMHAPHFRS